jgi:hypothetical protein
VSIHSSINVIIMDFENIVVKYVKRISEVPYVGQMEVHVRISENPIFEDARSMQLTYFSEPFDGHRGPQLGDSTTLSYRAAKADDYRQRMKVDIVLPHDCLRDGVNPYRESRKATQKLLPQIIAEHEKMMSAGR